MHGTARVIREAVSRERHGSASAMDARARAFGTPQIRRSVEIRRAASRVASRHTPKAVCGLCPTLVAYTRPASPNKAAAWLCFPWPSWPWQRTGCCIDHQRGRGRIASHRRSVTDDKWPGGPSSVTRNTFLKNLGTFSPGIVVMRETRRGASDSTNTAPAPAP